MSSRLAVLIALALAGSTGCSVIGLGIGFGLDKRRAKRPAPAAAWEVRLLEPGTRMVLTLDDGERVEGYLGGLELRPADEYAPLYAAVRAARPTGLDLPTLGRGVWLDAEGVEREGELVGLDLRGVLLSHGEDAELLPFSRVMGFRDAEGRTTSGEVFHRLVRARRLPTLSVIRLVRPERLVTLDDVAQVELYRASNSGKVTGFLIGAALDVAVAVWVWVHADDIGYSPCESRDRCTSCPIVLAFDGRSWQRQAEMLGAATLESAQLTDRATLDRIEPSGGLYRIRVANEMEEIDHLDAVRLLAVDLPSGARAATGPEGRVLALVDPRPPRLALDREGHDLTATFAARDGRVWLGSPLGRDPRRREDLSDGVLLEFDRPRGAEAVTLAFDARGTRWGVQMLVELLSLHGDGLDGWRRRVDADPEARAAFLTALAREGLPRVRVWDGRGWRLAGVLRNLGPALARRQALRVPIGDVPGEVLRVRVDATAGFWVLDSAMADFATAPSIVVHALEAVSAQAAGSDVMELLAAGDGRRVSLRRGEVVELAFRAPPEPPAGSRSIVVEATGYYTPLIHDTRPGDQAAFERLVSEPGALGRYNLQRLGEELDRAQAPVGSPASAGSR